MKDVRIVARVTEKERARINVLAKQCGLSQTEYVRQRALGYAPTAVPPDAFFDFCEKADALLEAHPPDAADQVVALLKKVGDAVLAPKREKVTPWPQPASGPSTET